MKLAKSFNSNFYEAGLANSQRGHNNIGPELQCDAFRSVGTLAMALVPLFQDKPLLFSN
jgi:hypothetical protein